MFSLGYYTFEFWGYLINGKFTHNNSHIGDSRQEFLELPFTPSLQRDYSESIVQLPKIMIWAPTTISMILKNLKKSFDEMSPLTSVAHPKPSLKMFLKSWTPFGHAEWGQCCSMASKSYKGKIMWCKMFSVSLLHF